MTIAEPTARRWSRDEYYRMADLGWFQDQRVELIEGEVVEMPPQKNLHAVALKLVERALEAAFGPNFWVRVQSPLDLPDGSAPEPDIAVVPGNPRDWKRHPQGALLVVEISDSTLNFDRTRKARLYAGAGISEYWVVNLVDSILEVYRNPVQQAALSAVLPYTDHQVYAAGQMISPLAVPEKEVAVADLLP